MLNTLRRNVRRLSWTLWLVIAAFIVLYIPNLVAGGGSNVVAEVAGDPIMAAEFQRNFNQQLSYYRNLNQGELPDDFAQSLQIRNVVLEQMIRQRLVLVAARDQGFAIAPQEIKDRIMEYPVFRDDEGHWVGDQEYLTILRSNGQDPASFEESIISELLVERLTGVITEGVRITDRELQDLYQRRNETVSFEFVQVRPTAFELDVGAGITVDELIAHYERDPDAYRLPEQRRVSYVLIDTETIRDAVQIDEDALRAEYEAKIADYTTGEQVKARQILFRVPPGASQEEKDEIRTRADEAAQRLAEGADFAQLAIELSDDPSAAAGGDLGWVTRGRQVEGFDEIAFELEPGSISEIADTAFGFHIIRVEEKRAEQVQPLEEVRGQLQQRLAWERAEEQASEMSEQLRREVLRGTGLEALTQEHGLSIDTSPLFTQETGFGEYISAEVTGRVFSLGQGRVGEPVRVRRGYLIFRVDEIAAPHTPAFEQCKEAVRADVIEIRARERAAQVASEYVERMRQGETTRAIADDASTVLDTAEALTRDGFVPALGRSAELLNAAFGLDSGQVGGPVEVDDRLVVFRLTEHRQPDWSLFAERQDALREQEIGERRNRLFEGFVQRLRDRYRVRIHEDVLQRVAG